MHESSMYERRKKEVNSFLSLPTFSDGCHSWEEFLEFSREEEGKPFSLILERCFGETTKSVEIYYFFGVTHIQGNVSFGRQCFTPLSFTTHTPFFFNSIEQGDLGFGSDLSCQSKIVSISFDIGTFESDLLGNTLLQVDNILKYSENHLYIVTLLGYLGILREALSKYSLQKFDNEVTRIKSKLGIMDCENVSASDTENTPVFETA